MANEHARERLREAADFRAVTPTQVHRWRSHREAVRLVIAVSTSLIKGKMLGLTAGE